MVFPTPMASRFAFLLLLLLVLVPCTQSATVSATSSHEGWGLVRYTTTQKKCNTVDGGLIGDCIEDKDEMALSSESDRRVLQTKGRYVSYAALDKNKVPCHVRGKSYYNCAKSGKANPYHRPCTVITRCQRILD